MPGTPCLYSARQLALVPIGLDSLLVNIIFVLLGIMFMSIPKPLDKELLLVLSSTMLNDIFDFISRSRSINVNKTRIGMCPRRELIVWILQPGSQKRSMDSNKTRESKRDFDHIVVGLGHTAEDLVRSHKDWLKFVKLSLFREAGGGDLDEVSNIVL